MKKKIGRKKSATTKKKKLTRSQFGKLEKLYYNNLIRVAALTQM